MKAARMHMPPFAAYTELAKSCQLVVRPQHLVLDYYVNHYVDGDTLYGYNCYQLVAVRIHRLQT